MTNMDHAVGRGRQPDDPGMPPWRAEARNFAQHLENAVRENPVPAALIGMGFLWMFMGGSRISLFGEDRARSTRSVSGGVGHAAYDVAQQGASLVSRIAGGAGETLSELGSRASGMTRTAATAIGEAAAATSSQIAQAASSAYEGSGSAAARAVDTLSDTATRASQTAQRVGSEWGRSTQESMADLFERQPLVLGAIGLAIGAGIAASLPRTEMESRLMGETSEALKEQARDLVSGKVDQAKDMAQRALQEAQAQGFTPRAAGDALRGFADKVVGVAETAGQSLKEQLQPEKAAGNGPRSG